MIIFIIHNTSDQDRKQNIETQFANQRGEWQYEIVPATMHSSQPAVGIMRSFKECISKAKEARLPYVCILEDDFNFLSPDSMNLFVRMWNTWPWQLKDSILLGGIYEGNVIPFLDQFRPFGRLSGKLSGLHAMIVPALHYDVILNAEEPYNLDYYLSEIAKIKINVAYPLLIMQNDGYSYNAGKITTYNEKIHLKYKLINDSSFI